MKRWEAPRTVVQGFEANEYVAACYTLACAIPGTWADRIGDGTSSRWFGDRPRGSREPATGSGTVNWGGFGVSSDGLLHGNCGNESTSYDVLHSIGYEHNNDGSIKNAVISNIQISPSPAYGNAYYATWESDNGYSKNYVHYGYALMSSNPNHS